MIMSLLDYFSTENLPSRFLHHIIFCITLFSAYSDFILFSIFILFRIFYCPTKFLFKFILQVGEYHCFCLFPSLKKLKLYVIFDININNQFIMYCSLGKNHFCKITLRAHFVNNGMKNECSYLLYFLVLCLGIFLLFFSPIV